VNGHARHPGVESIAGVTPPNTTGEQHRTGVTDQLLMLRDRLLAVESVKRGHPAPRNRDARTPALGIGSPECSAVRKGVPVAQNKTQITDVDPASFVASIDHPTRQSDAEVLLELMRRVTGCEPKMWGPSIVGFGRYHYRYESGREGEFMLAGFSPRKANIVVYTMPGYEDLEEQLGELGKHRLGKSCLYINKLADIDLAVLEQIVADGVAAMRATYETWDE
jgi:hypothetical protein